MLPILTKHQVLASNFPVQSPWGVRITQSSQSSRPSPLSDLALCLTRDHTHMHQVSANDVIAIWTTTSCVSKMSSVFLKVALKVPKRSGYARHPRYGKPQPWHKRDLNSMHVSRHTA
ncbi:hypothetical protein PCH_Pc21g05390 [Penicillium rubens Wisconsin 54-1255]|uniref:Uncharacterized protein n=1 Tax=Penicillium rubens (strain ATCC 28089 / DSM 1075 / NRRL 1951 / Wisconsin 54-1255) TaxID=500485 RepID=B6HHI5_PENRW|nr:hypothetical protein PCH_Pc21g05390 [Penicillium rubens Wisconsin 54-1255]